MDNNLNKKATTATFWSGLGEISSKLITPIISMVLARLLTPEAYGVVAAFAIIISFAQIFTDAGFQKYIVQHEFRDDTDLNQNTTVAFWSNLILSVFIWGLIAIFNQPLAKIVGCPDYGFALVVACFSIPLAAFSSIQSARYRRKLDFKTLFKIRLVGILVPLLVTLPLAVIFRNYWALLVSAIVEHSINAFLLTYFSEWKPRLYFSKEKLKEMFSFSVWSMFEAVTIWLTNYIDMFIIGSMLSTYYLGLYRTSVNIVTQIFALVTAATTPVLFSALSRLQNNESEFQRLFFRFQKIVGLLVLPLGVGLFLFSDLATSILLGNQWMEASGFIGLWGLTSSITIVLSHYSSEVFRAKGKPKLSVLAQILHIVVLWPTVLISVKYGFETLYIARSLVRFEMIAVTLCLMGIVIRMPVWRMIINIFHSFLAASCMCLVLFLPATESVVISFIYTIVATAIYLLVIMIFPTERNILLNLPSLIRRK